MLDRRVDRHPSMSETPLEFATHGADRQQRRSAMPLRTSTLALQILLLMLGATGCQTTSAPGTLFPPLPEARLGEEEFRQGSSAYEHASYDEAIRAFRKLVDQHPQGPYVYEAQWLLARSYEANGDLAAARRGYEIVRRQFPQTAYGAQALQRLLALDRRASMPATNHAKQAAAPMDYQIGEEDEIDISVYGDEDLSKTQIVRPGGNISFPLIGELRVADRTPQELREEITKKLAQYIINPRVTVVVKKYNSKQVYALGEVKSPGVLRLSSDITLLQAISRAEGIREDADLQGALLVREGQIVPVDFVQLLRHGDLSHNVLLKANDTILIPSLIDRKIQVLGEVNKPSVVRLRPGVTLSESIALAGGLTKDAVPENILILRGGLAHPTIMKVNFDDITKGGMAQNIALEPLDIVYVPRTVLATVERYTDILSKILQAALFGAFVGLVSTQK